MKKRITVLLAALVLLSGFAWGQTSVTWPGTTALPGTATAVANDQNVTIMVSSTNTYSNPIRIYANTTVTINALNNAKILSVAYEASSTGNYVTIAENATVTPDVTPTVSGKIVTWTYDESEDVTEFTFTPSAQTRSNGITITYIIPGATPTCATPTFSPAAGTYTEAQSVNVNCSTEGATIYYTTNGDNPTTNSTVYTAAINVSSDMTIKAMATAEGYDNSAIATAAYTIVNIEHAGTEADPYTVADARTAIDANVGVTGVYATGIVSEIVTAYNSTYGNITFDIVDEVGNSATLRAYRCGGTEAANVAVNDIVVVYGNLTKYGSTYEFGQDCEVVSLTHPVITTPVVTVTPNTIDAPFAGADGTLALTYENIENFISFDYYFCDANGGELEGNDPDWIYAQINEENDAYTLDYIIDANQGEARTAYIKVYTFDDNEEEVYAIVTVNQEAYVAPTYAELPFSFNGGKADIEETDGLSQEGLGTDYASAPKLKFDGTGDWLLLQFNERPGTLTFDIKNNSFSGGTFKVQTSEDGVTYTDLETYTEITGTQNEEFTDLGENVRYIKWIYTEKVSGNVGLGNIALAEYVVPVLVASITVNPDEVNVDAAEHDGTLALAYENLPITAMEDFNIQYYDAVGDETTEPDWIEVLVAEQDPEIGEGYVVSYYMMENEGTDARTAYFKVYAMDEETNLVYSNLVTVNQDAYVENITYTLTTTIESGRHYIIVGYKNNDAYAMGAQGNNNRSAESITLTNTGASVDLEVVSEFIINGPDADGYYTIYDAAVPGYLFAASSNSNYLRTKEFVDANGKWAITFNEENNAANIVAQGSNTRNVMRYNPNNNIFACYASGQNDVYLYVRDEEENYEFVTDITGYSTVENTAGGYYLIASPVNNVNPATVNGMLDNDYDLYYFNQSATNEEWQNYKANNFNLESGKGYLYANSETFTMHFTGTPQTPNESYVQLAYDANSEFAGMNLVGNPWGYAVSIDRPFYTLNDEGSEVVPSVVEAINPMQGVFVEADTDGETMYFTPYVPSSSSKLVLNVNKNRGALVDRTIISFDNNGRLPKFMINPDNTKIYIPQDNAEFAVVQSDDIEAEMPVNFKVNENGFYMINVDVKNMDLDYLHLIDHKTGNDVDLLATPNYGFNANISDYEARFSLVYRTFTGVNENNSETFAYFNGSEWVINNGENATVQVIDMLGRIVMSANNANSISTATMAPGTYVLRLTNGSEVMTQKIVVE